MFKNKGFTLIELLISISIIAILSGITLVLINPQVWRNRAQDTTRKEDLAVIQGALERYYSDNNAYPASLDPLESFNTIVYIKKLPVDPDTLANYTYTSIAPYQSYEICTTLEEPGPNDTDDRPLITGTQYCESNPF